MENSKLERTFFTYPEFEEHFKTVLSNFGNIPFTLQAPPMSETDFGFYHRELVFWNEFSKLKKEDEEDQYIPIKITIF